MKLKQRLVTRGKVTHLLKRSAKLPIQRNAAKTDELRVENLEEKKEESKEEDDMS